jgi:hypothetical protein
VAADPKHCKRISFRLCAFLNFAQQSHPDSWHGFSENRSGIVLLPSVVHEKARENQVREFSRTNPGPEVVRYLM